MEKKIIKIQDLTEKYISLFSCSFLLQYVWIQKGNAKKGKHLAMQVKLDFVPLFLGNKDGFLLSLP